MGQESDGEQGVMAVLAAMGGQGFRGLVTSLDTFGEDACDIVLRVAAGESMGQFGAPSAHGRAVHEDFGEVLCLAASHWPQRFAELVAANARLRCDGSVLWALGWADCELSTRLLIDAANTKEAGWRYARWSALMGLERLAAPALPDVLTSLIKDRADLVRATAVSVAIGYGDARLISHLHGIASADRTRPGTRAAAWDAIEAIKIREGIAEGPTGPHTGRVIPVRRPTTERPVRVLSLERALMAGEAEVIAAQQLAVLEASGERIAVLAPCAGCIISNLMAVGRPAPPVLAWIRAHLQP
jgi:hypothetical protein